jgi:hypothetical protein
MPITDHASNARANDAPTLHDLGDFGQHSRRDTTRRTGNATFTHRHREEDAGAPESPKPKKTREDQKNEEQSAHSYLATFPEARRQSADAVSSTARVS